MTRRSTENQALGMEVRAAAEEWQIEHRKRWMGWSLLPRNDRDEYLAKRFGISVEEVRSFLDSSWSRYLPWSNKRSTF